MGVPSVFNIETVNIHLFNITSPVQKLFALLAAILLFIPIASMAVDSDADYDISRARQSMDAIEFQVFVAGFQTEESIYEALRRLGNVRSDMLKCVSDQEDGLRFTSKTLGESFINRLNEGDEFTEEELQARNQVEKFKATIAECRIQLDKLHQLGERLDKLLRDLKRRELSIQKDHILKNLSKGFPGLPGALKHNIQRLFAISGFEKDAFRPSLLLVVLTGIVIGMLLWRRRDVVRPGEDSEHPYAISIFMHTRYLIRTWAPAVVPLAITILYLRYVEGDLFQTSQLNKFLLLVLAFIVDLIFLRAAVKWYAKYSSSELKFPIAEKGIYIRIIIAAALILVWTLIYRVPNVDAVDSPQQLLLHNLLSSAVIISLLEMLVYLPRFRKIYRLGSLVRIAGIILLSLSLVYEWFGYHSRAVFIWSSALMIAVSLTIFIFLEKLFRDLYDTLDAGQYTWQQKIRSSLSIGRDEPVPGSLWMRLFTITLLWIGLGLMLLKSIGVPDARIKEVFAFLRDGVSVGDSQISPISVLWGLLIFTILLVAIRWVKDSLKNKYLVKSKLDSGAKEAIVTITGYVGFTIAAIVGLSIAGVQFSNLAIIAGALSVGIGFGLQNIVNNFVSGIILLFERPIRPGDWIITGTTEGYVKRISVRSTEVQTFDRSEVIVPNSDLISSEVTNWTLRDNHGRIIIPIGVAYGSDTELVKKLLEEIPNDIPEIIKGRSFLPTKVLFKSFGDSALIFELRCYIYDIGYILDVKSKLHFAIDKAFREHDIEIAFPQRDIHIRSNESVKPVLE